MSEMGLPAAWSENADGSATGYMCMTDWEYEIGNACGGNRVFPSVRDLHKNMPCARSCGIVEVRVSCVRVVAPGFEPRLQAMETRQGGDDTAPSQSDDSAVAKPCSETPSAKDHP